MSEPTAPPPNYGAAVGMNNQESYPQPGVATTYQAPTDPPPKYEPAKTQVYGQPDQNPGGNTLNMPKWINVFFKLFILTCRFSMRRL